MIAVEGVVNELQVRTLNQGTDRKPRRGAITVI